MIELPLIISIIALVTSTSVSLFALFLTELRGPNIKLLNPLSFQVSAKKLEETISNCLQNDYVPSDIELEPIPFIFANHGGRSGTVLDLRLEFTPIKELKRFFDELYIDFGYGEKVTEPPVTIKEGDNVCLSLHARQNTIKWKTVALAEVLDSKKSVDELVDEAVIRSKENFAKFVSLLKESEAIGHVTCTVVLTGGRFRTKLVEKKLVENEVVMGFSEESWVKLPDLLAKWENLNPNSTQLVTDLSHISQDLLGELNSNYNILCCEINEQNIGQSYLRTDTYKRVQNLRFPLDNQIKLFLIRKQQGLETAIKSIYSSIAKYNSQISKVHRLGGFKTKEHYEELNQKRKTLSSKVNGLKERLESIQG